MVKTMWKRLLLGVVTLAVIPVVSEAEAPSLESARDAIRRGQWALAAGELEILLAAAPPEEVEAEAYYLRALLFRQGEERATALRDLQTLARLSAPLEILNAAKILEGELLYESGRYSEAGAVLGGFVARSPEHPRREHAEWFWAESLARADSCAAAVSVYDRLIASTLDDGVRQRATVGRGWCRRRLGHEDQAYRDFAVAANGLDAETAARARFEAGASAYRLGRHIDALDWLEGRRGGIARGDSSRLEKIIGQSLFELNRREEAVPHLERAMELADEEGRWALLYQLGWVRLESGLHEEAIRLFGELLQTRGAEASLRTAAEYGRGIALLRMERFNEAISPLEKVRATPASTWRSEALYSLAYAYNRLGDYPRSQAAIDELRSDYPDSPFMADATLVQGENLFYAQRYEEAIQAYRERIARGEGDRADALFKLGVALFKVERFGECVQALSNLVLRFPASPHRTDARFWLAEAYYRKGDLSEAREEYDALKLLGPSGPYARDVLYGLAWCDYSESNFAEAAGRFGLLLEQFPGSDHEDDTLYRRGNCFYNLRRFDEAVLDYDRMLRRYPNSPLAERALYQKAWSLYRADRYPESLTAFDGLEVRFPESPMLPQAVHWGAYALFKAERYGEAAERFGRVSAMGSAPDSLRTQARLRMAESYFNSGDFNRSATLYKSLAGGSTPQEIREVAYSGWLRSLESGGRMDDAADAAVQMSKALPESETSGEALYRIGVRYLDSGKWKDGIRSLRAYLKAGVPEQYRVDANRRCAVASLKLGEKLRAAEYYRNAAYYGSREDGVEYRFEAGRLFYELGKHELARTEFDRVIRLKPDAETLLLARYNLGLCLKDTEHAQEALDAFVEVGSSDKVDAGLRADALLEAGLLARDQGDRESARDYLGRAGDRGRGATGAEAQYWRADLAFEAKLYDEAIAAIMKMLKRYPDEEEWALSGRYRLATCFERLNRWVEAREQYRLIIDQTNDETWAGDARKRLEWIEENSWVFEEEPGGDPSRWEG